MLAFDLHREELWWFVRVFSLRTDLSNPRELGWWLFFEHIDLVVAHALLSHNDFLTTIDDEVPTLVISAILAIFDSLVLIEILQLAKITAQHDWHLAYVDSIFLRVHDHPLDFPLPLACLGAVVVVVIKLFLAKFDISVEFSGVG